MSPNTKQLLAWALAMMLSSGVYAQKSASDCEREVGSQGSAEGTWQERVSKCLLDAASPQNQQTATDGAAPLPRDMPSIFGYLSDTANIGVVSSGCYITPSKTLSAGALLVVAGRHECTSRYSSPKQFYRVMYAGDSHYVSADSLKVAEKDLARLDQVPEGHKPALQEHARLLSLVQRKNDLEDLVKAFESHKRHGLTIIKASIADVSEHTEGTSFKVRVSNPTEKTIKYITFSVVGLNAVGDPVRDRIKGGPTMVVRAIGPIEKDEGGTYNWEYMWHTDIVEKFRITEVKVQYMDNSIRVIRDLRAIMLKPEQLRTYEE